MSGTLIERLSICPELYILAFVRHTAVFEEGVSVVRNQMWPELVHHFQEDADLLPEGVFTDISRIGEDILGKEPVAAGLRVVLVYFPDIGQEVVDRAGGGFSPDLRTVYSLGQLGVPTFDVKPLYDGVEDFVVVPFKVLVQGEVEFPCFLERLSERVLNVEYVAESDELVVAPETEDLGDLAGGLVDLFYAVEIGPELMNDLRALGRVEPRQLVLEPYLHGM